MTGKPTLLILAGMGKVIHNFLRSDFLEVVQEGLEVVVLSPLGDDPDFRESLRAKGVETRSFLSAEPGSLHRRVNGYRSLLHFLFCDTETMRVKLRRGRTWHTPLQNARIALRQAMCRPLAHRWTLKLLDAAAQRTALRAEAAEHYRDLFEEIRPDLVLSGAPNFPVEALPVHVARDMGISVVASILAWDNLSSKARLPIHYDHYFVWNERMERELLEYYPEVRPEEVSVTGAPQFDHHRDPDLMADRKAFWTEIGLDPRRPVIVYGGVTPNLVPDEPEIIRGLVEAIRRGEVEGTPQLYVRLHPRDDGSRYRDFPERFPEVAIAVPGARSGGSPHTWNPGREDLRLLVNTLVHGDVHINIASTITVDAAIMNRPVINVRFGGGSVDGELPPGLEGYDYTHYRPILETGGVRLADSPGELVRHLNAYLRDPSLDAEGRRRIVKHVAGRVDGSAARRVGRRILDLMKLQDGRRQLSTEPLEVRRVRGAVG